MTPEQAAAFIHAQSVCAMAAIQGMIAENQHRVACGHSVAYGEDAFSAIPDQYGIGHNTVCTLFEDANRYP